MSCCVESSTLQADAVIASDAAAAPAAASLSPRMSPPDDVVVDPCSDELDANLQRKHHHDHPQRPARNLPQSCRNLVGLEADSRIIT